MDQENKDAKEKISKFQALKKREMDLKWKLAKVQEQIKLLIKNG